MDANEMSGGGLRNPFLSARPSVGHAAHACSNSLIGLIGRIWQHKAVQQKMKNAAARYADAGRSRDPPIPGARGTGKSSKSSNVGSPP
ncbi:hypothetical protein SAMN05443247_02701 [Bradyrhizobium erythrophlei]|nr:hypothetical protein SAMN05443247_02701 [Bradyrhizobium erythrophlei]